MGIRDLRHVSTDQTCLVESHFEPLRAHDHQESCGSKLHVWNCRIKLVTPTNGPLPEPAAHRYIPMSSLFTSPTPIRLRKKFVMNTGEPEPNRISRLIDQFASDEPVLRESSREELIELGGTDVTRALVLALIDPQTHVRWEAAKTLQAIADPVAAPALMNALDDEDEDVRWVAAEGLIALGKVGLQTVLSGLIKRASSIAFCTSAHHVLHEIKSGTGVAEPVMKAWNKKSLPFQRLRLPTRLWSGLAKRVESERAACWRGRTHCVGNRCSRESEGN